MPNFGLQPLRHDTSKDIKVGAYFNLPDPKTLPKEFSLGEPIIENQGNSDLCSAYATTSSSEFQEGTPLNPYYTFALTKEIEGDFTTYGGSLKDAMASHVKVGAIERDATHSTSRDIKEYHPNLKEEAKKHKKETYVSIQSSGLDSFDAIKSFIYKFRDEKRAVVFGVEFGWDLHDKIMEEIKPGGGHALYTYGWKTVFKDSNDKIGEPYLLVANSYGIGAGDNGTHLFSRKVINEWVGSYGAYAFVDMPREDLQNAIDRGIKEDTYWFVAIFKAILELFKSPFLNQQEKTDLSINIIKEAVEVNVKEDKLLKFCLAIQEFEGYFKDSHSWRNNNPGNIKGLDGKFLTFKTYEEGLTYLKNYVLRVARNGHRAYPKDCNIQQFFNVYAPTSDKNNPTRYTQFVCDKVGIKVTDLVVQLVKSSSPTSNVV